MNNKRSSILYGITILVCFLNAYFAYRANNIDATIAWFVAGGLSGGASGAYMKLLENEKKENDDK